ncbi:MAG: hypothetical protein AAB484_03260 [Patescibacteria group bacterium]
MKNNRGIIKALIAIVVGLSVLFLLFAMAAKYTAPIGSSPSSSGGSYSTDYMGKTNSLLNFLDSANYGNYSGGGSDRTAVSNIDSKNRSKYSGKVYLSSGNASYTIQPYEEYITIKNDGAPVNITGWKVTNAKGTRPIEYSQNSYVYPSAESGTIGQGTGFLDPSGKYSVGNIILGTDDTAIITTSGPFSYFPLPITTNFRENMCLGYLENYPFSPPIEQQCPYPTNDSQIRTVTDECYDYLQSLSRCQNPQKTDIERFDELTSQCRAFIKVRLNYPSCVANNRYSPNFASKQWRIFLGKSHQLWAANREIITLYDATNLIVDQISY